MYSLLFSFNKLEEFLVGKIIKPQRANFCPHLIFVSQLLSPLSLFPLGTDATTRLKGVEDKRIVFHTTTHLPTVELPLN